MKKLFLEATVLVLLIYSCFLQEKQIFRSPKWGRPDDACETQSRDVAGTK